LVIKDIKYQNITRIFKYNKKIKIKVMKVTELKEIISKELNKLNRSIVATPDSRENLDSFAKANQGSSDMILTQMAIQFGYKLAMDSIVDIIEQ
jgi:hypothetical protein